MDIIQEAHLRLFPASTFLHTTQLEYNRRLGAFNANIQVTPKKIKVHMNLQWKDIDDEIKIGLIQDLLLRVFKKKKETLNTKLYAQFVKNIPTLMPKNNIDPYLKESFDRVNTGFFDATMAFPNLVWGRASTRKLAHYNFHNDTVTMSTIFKDAPKNMLDYIMYHELLHKYHKFEHGGGRNAYHTRAFREDEAKFPGQQKIEQAISSWISKKKKRGLLSWL